MTEKYKNKITRATTTPQSDTSLWFDGWVLEVASTTDMYHKHRCHVPFDGGGSIWVDHAKFSLFQQKAQMKLTKPKTARKA